MSFTKQKNKESITHANVSLGVADALSVEGERALEIGLGLQLDEPDSGRPLVSVEQQVEVLDLGLRFGEELPNLFLGHLERQPLKTQNHSRHDLFFKETDSNLNGLLCERLFKGLALKYW